MKTCVNCGKQPTENHHYKGIYSNQFGGGGGNLKTFDWMVSELCRGCHRAIHDMSGQFKRMNKELFSEIQLIWSFETIQRKIARGAWQAKTDLTVDLNKSGHELFLQMKEIERKIEQGGIIIL
jgi:hypothetical protein